MQRLRHRIRHDHAPQYLAERDAHAFAQLTFCPRIIRHVVRLRHHVDYLLMHYACIERKHQTARIQLCQSPLHVHVRAFQYIQYPRIRVERLFQHGIHILYHRHRRFHVDFVHALRRAVYHDLGKSLPAEHIQDLFIGPAVQRMVDGIGHISRRRFRQDFRRYDLHQVAHIRLLGAVKPSYYHHAPCRLASQIRRDLYISELLVKLAGLPFIHSRDRAYPAVFVQHRC